MKLILAVAGSGALVGSAYAGGLLTQGDVHNVPMHEARARLIAMELPSDMLLIAGGSDSAKVSVTSDSDSVSWRVASAVGSDLFTAKLEALSAGRTRVSLEHSPAKPGTSMAAKLTSTRFMRGFSDSSFSEAVDATLEGRQPDRMKSLDTFARYQQMNPADVKELGETMNGMFHEVHDQMNQHVSENSTPVVDPMYGKARPSLPVKSE